MGLYSIIYSSYEALGLDFLGDFQTKDLESLLDEYWLSPAGELFLIDYDNCFTASPQRFPKNFLDVIDWQSTGTHAKMKPISYTGSLTMYRTACEKWIEAELEFENGKVSLVLDQQITPLP